jgi:osmoprotectant transport system substrate-binding protein
VGLQTRYGITFRAFVPLDTESQRITALQESVANVALLFTTEGQLASGEFVLLRDDRGLQPAENVVPVVSSRALTRYGTRISRALDAVSERMSQQNLIELNWRIGVAGKDPRAEARGWLIRQGLLPRA